MKNSEINNTPLAEATAKKRGGFTSKIGFVLAAAGSAVGLGNLWRFPYLAAQYGGGIFVLSYALLAVFFGLILLMLEIGIGRHTGKSVIGAFSTLNKKFSWFGYLCVIVPLIIVPYYCVIGGWVIKYMWSFLVGSQGLVEGAGAEVNTETFFTSFISSPIEPLVFFLIFAAITVLIVTMGVQKGIEKMSKILMPALAIIAVFLMIYGFFQDGALEGVAYFLIPDFTKFSFKTVLGALGQLFYSLSIGMCIMITYGSYMKKDASIKSSSVQIAAFDSLFAIIAGLIIIPAVFAFAPTADAAHKIMETNGATLMFIQISNVFNSIPGGRIIGIIFFILVFFAAVTSSVSLVESIVAVLCEDGRMKRWVACLIVFGAILVLGTLSSLGYGVLSFINIAGNSILDLFDILANNILMPIIAIITCVVAGWFIDKNILPKEIGIDKSKGLTRYFNIMIKYIAPICILLILITGLFIKI
ncbi:MAG: sodium-dependent transporter [Clostridiales bacterium]|nr:sodium-dependent transporter [Clostridiales bacterium]